MSRASKKREPPLTPRARYVLSVLREGATTEPLLRRKVGSTKGVLSGMLRRFVAAGLVTESDGVWHVVES